MNKTSPSRQRKLKHCLSPGLPYLPFNTMSDSLQLEKLHVWSSWKALQTRRPQQHISSQSKLYKRKKSRTQMPYGYPRESLAGSPPPPPPAPRPSFILLSTACLIHIKTPSYIQARLLLNRLEISSPPTDLEEQFSAPHKFSRVKAF